MILDVMACICLALVVRWDQKAWWFKPALYRQAVIAIVNSMSFVVYIPYSNPAKYAKNIYNMFRGQNVQR